MRKNPTECVQLQLTAEQMQLLRLAASARRQTVVEFALESGILRANDTLPDRSRFKVSAPEWTAFQEALQSPAQNLPRLRMLLD